MNEYKKSLSIPTPPTKVEIEYVIKFDSTPFIPSGLMVAPDEKQIASRVRGNLALSNIKIRLHLDDAQKHGNCIGGYNLKPKLEGQEVYGAQLLDFYLGHPDLIPEELKAIGWTYFWGTIYCNWLGRLFVRYLINNGKKKLDSLYSEISIKFNGFDPAAVSASTQG